MASLRDGPGAKIDPQAFQLGHAEIGNGDEIFDGTESACCPFGLLEHPCACPTPAPGRLAFRPQRSADNARLFAHFFATHHVHGFVGEGDLRSRRESAAIDASSTITTKMAGARCIMRDTISRELLRNL